MKIASAEHIKQISMGNMGSLVEFMKEAREHSLEVMLGEADRGTLPEHRAEIKTLHDLIKLVETSKATAIKIDLADSETGSVSLDDPIPNTF
jgi:hypothetical protein